MPKSFRKPLKKWEIPSLSVLFTKPTPASIGNSVIADTHFRSETIIVPITISKTGQLTFPISGYRHYGFPCTPWTSLSRNSSVSLVPSYYRNSLTLWIPYKFIRNFYPTISQPSQTNGCLWIVPPFWKYRRHQQNLRVAGTQWTTLMDVVLLWALSMNREEIGGRNAISERLHWGLTCGTMKTQDQRSPMPVSRWSTTIGPARYVLCPASIKYHHQASSMHSTNRYNH